MSMRLDLIARSVFDALANDYAGMPECDDGLAAHWDKMIADAARSRILYDKTFYRYMSQRLASLRDHNLMLLTGPNCSFQPQTCGFETRRSGDRLWVTQVQGDTRLRVGDSIIALGKQGLDEYLAAMPGNLVNGNDHERQHWDDEIAAASHFVVERADGSRKDLKTRLFPMSALGHPATLQVLADGSVLLRVGQFDTEEAAAMLALHADDVKGAPRLVIDLRHCSGGVESATYPLLNYVFDSDVNLRDAQPAETLLTNYTRSNCDRRLQQIAQLRTLSQARPGTIDRAMLAWLDENERIVRENYGKGYVEENALADDFLVHAAPSNQRLVILTDVTTSDAAEWFVRLAKTSPRVTVVGRATAGNLDYSNPLTMTFEDRFIFTYPMSKTKSAAQGLGILGRGIEPTIHVPFVPEECVRDLVLEAALQA